MSPRKAPARIETNRRNAQKSTAPRTARGRAQSRMSSLRILISSCTERRGSRTAPTDPPRNGWVNPDSRTGRATLVAAHQHAGQGAKRPLTPRDVKNGTTSGDVYENKRRATNCTPINPAFYTKMQQLRDNRQQSAGLIGRKCTGCARIRGEGGPKIGSSDHRITSPSIHRLSTKPVQTAR